MRAHCFVYGKVQGVNFRFYTKRIAKESNLDGWVKNLKDGRVEVVAEGEVTDIEKFLQVLNKGPILSKVEKIVMEKERYTGEFSGFEIVL